jgi:transcriptional regulator with XRE-family HTH domain
MQHTLQSYFIEWIRNVLRNKNISQTDLANNTNYSRQTVSNYLTGRTDITFTVFEKFVCAVDLNLIDFFGDFYYKTKQNKSPYWIKEPESTYIVKPKNSNQSSEIESLYLLNEQIKLYKKIEKSLLREIEIKDKYIDELENRLDKNGKKTG